MPPTLWQTDLGGAVPRTRTCGNGVSDCVVDRRSGRGGTLYRNAARPFDTARAGGLARCRLQPSGSHSLSGAIRRGDVASGLQLLRAGFDELGEDNAAFRHVTFLSEMAEALGRAGQIADGLVTIDEALARSERTEERWPIAEFLHVKGELLLSQSAQGAAVAAEDHFRQALDWARRQGALSWELRAATRAIAEFNAASGGQSPTHNLPPRRDRLERAGCHPWAASHRCVLWDSVRRGRSSG
jgi:hypothetical protein